MGKVTVNDEHCHNIFMRLVSSEKIDRRLLISVQQAPVEGNRID
jgi:hypothetical protein